MSAKNETYGKRFRDSLKGSRVKIVGLAATGMGLVASASALDINATVGPKFIAS